MARFVTRISTQAPAGRALDHLADFETVAQWDPGIASARWLSGDPGRVGARYEVVAAFGPRHLPLEYEVIERRDPEGEEAGRVVLVASTGTFTSHDTITVTPLSTGSVVEYDAHLTLHGLGRVLDWPMNRVFQVIGSRAERGLHAALAGLTVADDLRPQ